MEKILAFVINKDKILLLLSSNKDPQFHKSFWYTVTGAYEETDSCLENTVKREVLEETNLNVNNVIDLNWTFEYDSLGKHCIEHAYIAYTEDSSVKLNEESIEYKWCKLNDYIDKIEWYSDKNELRSILEKYVVRC